MYDALEIGLQLFQVAYGKLYVTIYYFYFLANRSRDTEQYQSPLMDPGGSLSAMLEELADVLTIESWNVVFGWVERRGETITAVCYCVIRQICYTDNSRSRLLGYATLKRKIPYALKTPQPPFKSNIPYYGQLRG